MNNAQGVGIVGENSVSSGLNMSKEEVPATRTEHELKEASGMDCSGIALKDQKSSIGLKKKRTRGRRLRSERQRSTQLTKEG